MMNNERELLRRALDQFERWHMQSENDWNCEYDLKVDIRAYLTSDKEVDYPFEGWRLREVYFEDGTALMHREPSKPEEKPVAWIIGYQTMTGDVGKKLSWSKSAAEVCNRLQGEQYETPLYLHPAELEDAPVAWTSQNELNALGTDVTCSMYSEPMIGENNIPLYTRPAPERKPMTEDELRKAFLSTNTAEPLSEGWPGLERFARAIEKHHGIKEEL